MALCQHSGVLPGHAPTLKPSLPCREFPGLLDDIRVWFRDYKKPENTEELSLA